MRKLIYAINLTIDGCLDHTKMLPNEEILEFFAHPLRDYGLHVYGRITYQLMVPYWPDVAKDPSSSKEDKDFADAFVAIPKVVFSKTLGPVDDKMTRVVNTDLKEEILRLKQEPGKDILVGGVDIPAQLIALGLVDEFLFVIHPTLAGKGRRLWDDVTLPETVPLTLVDSKILKAGHVALRYVKS